jgi:hypothetical protein
MAFLPFKSPTRFSSPSLLGWWCHLKHVYMAYCGLARVLSNREAVSTMSVEILLSREGQATLRLWSRSRQF